ncbi:GIN domain-containing protein [Pseudomonas veronii]
MSVAGSGDIDAYVSDSVKARVAGSGDIVIRGNPPIRDHTVAGSGDIKFKKK